MLRLTGELEQLVLKILREQKAPLIPSEVQALLKTYKELAYTTVMTVLKRLYQKKLLKRKKHGKAFAYYTNNSGTKVAQTELKTIFNELINSYGNLAISNFVDAVNTSSEHKEQLNEYLKHGKK